MNSAILKVRPIDIGVNSHDQLKDNINPTAGKYLTYEERVKIEAFKALIILIVKLDTS